MKESPMPKTRKGRLSHFEQLILAAITGIGEDAYSVRVQSQAIQLLGDEVPFGAVCVTLHRLERKGYLESDTVDPKPERGGRATRVYALTADGRKALESSIRISARIVAAVLTQP